MRPHLITILALALVLPACAQDEPTGVSAARMSRVGVEARPAASPYFQLVMYDDVDRHGDRLFPEIASFTWSDANAGAKTLKYRGRTGHLAEINTAEEREAVYDVIGENACWVGAVQASSAATVGAGWSWQGGGNVDASLWSYPPDPNDWDGTENHEEDVAIALRLEMGPTRNLYIADVINSWTYTCMIVEF